MCENCLKVAEAVKREAGVRLHVTPRLRRTSVREVSNASKSMPDIGTIWAPFGNTVLGLSTLAHEAGHVATFPPSSLSVSERERIEWEFKAWEWGFAAIRRNGGVVTRYMQNDARKAFKSYIRVPLDTLPRYIAAWVRKETEL